MLSDIAKNVVRTEREALEALEKRIGPEFEEACRILFDCQGKVIVTGMGKSGIIGQKIAATLSSTGTPAFFMHPAEGLHGDLGVISKRDVVLAISNSGNSEEVVKLLPIFKRLGVKIVVMSGKRRSALAKGGDVFLDIAVAKEACPLNLAPTASTTVTLALGDALAVALLTLRGFSEDDFALRHPGGALGRRLLLKVSDLMHTGSALPLVKQNVQVKDALFEITAKKLGCTGVTDEKGVLVGIVTDGDLRRALERHANVLRKRAGDIMTADPKWITRDELAAKALQIMESRSITSLFVFEGPEKKKLAGIVHIHDILKAGVV